MPEVPPAPIAVEMLAQLADGLSPVAAVLEAVVICPLIEVPAFATETPNIGRDIFEQKPRHLMYHDIRQEYSDRVGK